MDDLWPKDVGQVEVKAPVTLLREQASLLDEKTKHIVTATVERGGTELMELLELEQGNVFNYNFYIVAPALEYRYKLFSIMHGIDMYPVEVIFEGEAELKKEVGRKFKGAAPGHVKASSEEEFLLVLRAIFNSGKTRKIIGAVLAQSAS